jgi:hypothetical protein
VIVQGGVSRGTECSGKAVALRCGVSKLVGSWCGGSGLGGPGKLWLGGVWYGAVRRGEMLGE